MLLSNALETILVACVFLRAHRKFSEQIFTRIPLGESSRSSDSLLDTSTFNEET